VERCLGCNQDVEFTLTLDPHCNRPYCRDCIVKLENYHGQGKMYEEVFENPDGRKCDKCGNMLYKYYLTTHFGHETNFDCVFCKSCIDTINEEIQNFKKKVN